MSTGAPAEIVRRVALAPRGENEALPRSTLSSSAPLADSFGVRQLVHTEDAVDLSRAENGLPILIAHEDRQLPVGRLVDVRLEGDRLRGTPVLSGATQMARDAAALVDDGTLTDLSIRASIQEDRVTRDASGNEIVEITRWTPLEASLVAIGHDTNAGIGRAHAGDPAMTGTTTTDPTTPDPLAAELSRQQAIVARRNDLVAALPGIADQVRAESDAMLLDRSVTVERALTRFLELVPAATPAAAPGGGGTATQGRSELQRFHDGAVEALCIRAGVGTVTPEQIATNEFTSYSQVELARHHLERSGVSTAGMTRMDIVGQALTRAVDGPANTGTTDYPEILANVLNKAIFQGFDENPRTWSDWCSIGASNDFKPFTRPGLSAFTDLVQVAENAAFTDGIRVDKSEGGVISTYGRLYSITRQAIINDDLGAFTANGRAMGEAAARLVDTLPYVILTTNPLMNEDGVALFAAGHNNLGTAAVTETTINDMKVAMLRQADQNAIQVAPRLTYLIGPPELSQTVEKLLSDQQLPVNVDGVGAAREHNTVAGRYMWVESEHLSDVDAWYGAARKGQTIEVVFLEGRQAPTLEQERGFTVDAMFMKVRHDAVAFALDYRGLAAEIPA